MAEVYAPFDAGAGSAITEVTWQKMARRWLATGVIRGYLNTLAVSAGGTAMSVSVASGGAWIEGFYYETDAAVAQTITAADATNPRIDRVVVQLDRTANTVSLVVLAGTPAASPVAPTLTQTDTLWQISLAQVLVDAAVGVIAAGKVTDERVLVQNGPKPIQGLAANLPTVRQQGLVYYATDTDVLYYDDGTTTHAFQSTADANAAYVAKTLVTAKGDVIAATASGAVTNVPVGANNTVLTADSTQPSGVKWAAASGGGLKSAHAVRSAGDISVTSTTFVPADTALDLTLAAVAGDVLLIAPNGLWDTGAVIGQMDVVTMVGTTQTNFVSGNARGVAGWSAPANVNAEIGGPMFYTVVAGDISGGNVVLRLMVNVLTAGTKVLYAGGAYRLAFAAVNLGH